MLVLNHSMKVLGLIPLLVRLVHSGAALISSTEADVKYVTKPIFSSFILTFLYPFSDPLYLLCFTKYIFHTNSCLNNPTLCHHVHL